MCKPICQKPAHFLSAIMALLRTFFQMFTVTLMAYVLCLFMPLMPAGTGSKTCDMIFSTPEFP